MAKKKRKLYIALEVDALEDAAKAARRAGVHEDVVLAGLPRAWFHCWRKKTDRIRPEDLASFFTGCAERLRQALAAHRFLEIDGHPDGDRVKGAERLLRISASRSKGGHAAKGNLRRGSAESPAHAGDGPGSVPADARLLQPAASSQQPAELPPNPPRTEGGGSERAPRQRRDRSRDPASVIKIGECAGCGRGASAALGEGSARVKLCYGRDSPGCIDLALAWAEAKFPNESWRADFAGWARERRNATGPPGTPSSSGGVA